MSRVSVSVLVLSFTTYNSLVLLVATSLSPPACWGPSSLPTHKQQASKPIYLSCGPLISRLSSQGTQKPAGWFPSSPNSPNPVRTVISVPRAQCEGSRRGGWLPGQRRIKPLLCQCADWLLHVPPPAILRVGGRGKGLGWAGRGASVPCQPRTAPSWPSQSPGAQEAQSPTGGTGLALSLPPNTQGGCRWQCLWRQQLCLSLQADAELLRLRWCAQHRAPRTGICT